MGKPSFSWCVKRCMQTELPVIVATPEDENNKPIWKWCEREGIALFKGDKENVLKRYLDCAKKHDADPIIRITADCPFINPDIILAVAEAFDDKRVGWGVEMFSLATLQEMYDEYGFDEHVTSNMDSDWIDFDWIKTGEPLTLDFQADYDRLCELAPLYAS
jgi:spore coat polysaccharide biosynthesis protein SpsF (cytidylyltransferase family)